MEETFEIFRGHLIIKSIFAGSKSDGNYAYLFTDSLKIFRLDRKDQYAASDRFFYEFNKMYVEIKAEIFQNKILIVKQIKEISDPFKPINNHTI